MKTNEEIYRARKERLLQNGMSEMQVDIYFQKLKTNEQMYEAIKERLLQNGMSEIQVNVYFEKFINGQDGAFGALVDSYPGEEFEKIWFSLSDADQEEFMPIVFPILGYTQTDTRVQALETLRVKIAEKEERNKREIMPEDKSWFSFRHEVGPLAKTKSSINHFLRTNKYASTIIFFFKGKTIKDIYNDLIIRYKVMINNYKVKREIDKIIKTNQDPSLEHDAACGSDCMWHGVKKELRKETYPENIKSTRQEAENDTL